MLINVDAHVVFEEIIVKLDKLVTIVQNLVDMVPVMLIMFAFVIQDGLANCAIEVNQILQYLLVIQPNYFFER